MNQRRSLSLAKVNGTANETQELQTGAFGGHAPIRSGIGVDQKGKARPTWYVTEHIEGP